MELVIVRGEEFKVAVKEKIKVNDIFFEEYKDAAKKLEDVICASKVVENKKKKTDGDYRLNVMKDMLDSYENNIIAFCGERGDGKSSAMMTFINEVIVNKGDSALDFSIQIKDTYFAPPIIIDPSIFDGIHNVLDIVLAKLFQSFKETYSENNQRVSAGTREELVNKFQMVYKYVSLINDEKKMLDDEYDYEGNISKLSNLGASTNLKNEFYNLIDSYLEFIQKCNISSVAKGQLIIAIDDLDLCSKNAYKMAEQLRKYMILPNVIIVMAVKVEQLELCIEEANRLEFKEVLSTRKKEEGVDYLNEDFLKMSERYSAKLIPKSRRIYLPKIDSFRDIHVIFKELDVLKPIWETGINNDFVFHLLKLIQEKTGMIFLRNTFDENALIPSNLREMINLFMLLINMKTPIDKESKVYNINYFKNYIENSWIDNNLPLFRVRYAKELLEKNGFRLHVNIEVQLRLLFNDFYSPNTSDALNVPIYGTYYSILSLIKLLEQRAYINKEENYIYFFKILYTIKLNTIFVQENNKYLVDFIGGYLWGDGFSNTIPGIRNQALDGPVIDRSRFPLRPDNGFNTIIKFLFGNSWEPLKILENTKSLRIEKLEHDMNRQKYLFSWFILGVFSNTTDISSSITGGTSLGYKPFSIISNNKSILSLIQISLENYIVSLCNINYIYEKVNMDILGVTEEEYIDLAKKIESLNEKSIKCARIIATNVDLSTSLRNHCFRHRDYKESGKTELGRSIKLTEKFLKNVVNFMNQYDVDIELDDLKYIKYEFEEGLIIKISVSELYGKLIEACLEDVKTQQILGVQLKKEEQIKQFKNKICNDRNIIGEVDYKKLLQYLKNRNAKRIKELLDSYAETLNAYRVKSKGSIGGFSVEDWCDLYREIIDISWSDDDVLIGDTTANKYKDLVKKLDGFNKNNQ